jgi:hypothetical protein
MIDLLNLRQAERRKDLWKPNNLVKWRTLPPVPSLLTVTIDLEEVRTARHTCLPPKPAEGRDPTSNDSHLAVVESEYYLGATEFIGLLYTCKFCGRSCSLLIRPQTQVLEQENKIILIIISCQIYAMALL